MTHLPERGRPGADVHPWLAVAATGRAVGDGVQCGTAVPEREPDTTAVMAAWHRSWGGEHEAYLIAANVAEADQLNLRAHSMLVADGTVAGQVARINGLELMAGDRVVMAPKEPCVRADAAAEEQEGVDIPSGSIGTVERVFANGAGLEVDFPSAGRVRLEVAGPDAARLRYAYATCEPLVPAAGVVAELDGRLGRVALAEPPALEFGR